MGKIDRRVEILGHPGMLTEFPSLVKGDRVHPCLVRSEALGHCSPDSRGGFVPDPLGDGIRGLAFDQLDHGPPMAFAYNGVPLPVANPLSGVHHLIGALRTVAPQKGRTGGTGEAS